MGSYYTDKYQCPFDPSRVLIYKIRGSKKGSYYVRIKRAQRGAGYWSRSLDCTDQRTAIGRARRYWVEMITAEQRGVTYGRTNFAELFQDFLGEKRFAKDRRARVVHIYTRYFGEFFSHMSVADIDIGVFREYIHWRWDYWTRKQAAGEELPYHIAIRPSSKTLRSERQVLSQFLKWCRDKNVIDDVPNFPFKWAELDIAPTVRKARGRPLSDPHYSAIIRKLYVHACVAQWEAGVSGRGVDEDGFEYSFEPDPMRYMTTDRVTAYARLRLYYFVVITGNLLLRQGTEASKLLWENVEHRVDPRDSRKKYAIVRVLYGKMGRREPVFTPYGRAYKQMLRWHNIARSFGVGGPEQHVFGDLAGEYVPVHYLGRMHSRMSKKWGLDRHADGTKITLYSYRHTAIRRRIVRSRWDLYRVAQAANTSALTISTSYADDWAEVQKERYTNVFADPADLERVLDEQPELLAQIDDELRALGLLEVDAGS